MPDLRRAIQQCRFERHAGHGIRRQREPFDWKRKNSRRPYLEMLVQSADHLRLHRVARRLGVRIKTGHSRWKRGTQIEQFWFRHVGAKRESWHSFTRAAVAEEVRSNAN